MYDLIVIGAGSGGLAAAKRAAGLGQSVMLCEYDSFGGTCVTYGCVPKKLWHGVGHMHHMMQVAKDQGWDFSPPSFNWEMAQNKIQSMVKGLNKRHKEKCEAAGVHTVYGKASFINEHSIDVGGNTYQAKHILIAVGSKAQRLAFPGSELCDTSYEFFSWPKAPKTVAIIGGGYIAVELASILNALGVEVHIIIRKEQVLSGFDADVRSFLQGQYQARGVMIHSKDTPESVTKETDGLHLNLSSGESLIVDKVIQAVGRVPHTASLNGDLAGIKCSSRGAIIVNDRYQSSNARVYALGDCIDKEQLTPVAIAQARQWVDMMYGKSPFQVSFDWIPTAVFSLPELGSVGVSEDQAREMYSNVHIEKLSFNPLAMALTEHKDPVLMKLICEGENQRVVGIHLVAAAAAEIVQSLAIAVQKGICKSDLDLTMALHPTVMEELVTIQS